MKKYYAESELIINPDGSIFQVDYCIWDQDH